MKKIVLAWILGSIFVLHNVAAPAIVKAAALENPKLSMTKQNLKKKAPNRNLRATLSDEEIIGSLHKEYDADTNEIKGLLKRGYKYNELKTAYYYAALTNTDVIKVLSLHESATWGRVKVLLGLDAEKFAVAEQKYQLARLSSLGILDIKQVKRLMKEGYPLNDIKIAAGLALKESRNIEDLLKLKTVVRDWKQIQSDFTKEDGRARLEMRRKRGQRFGAGFAGLHVRNMTKERALRILSRDYQFSEQELDPLFDILGFEGLEDVCLHAYMGRVSLQQIMKMREELSWERIKHILGLTPSVYFERCVEYQARRLSERMGIPISFTKKYMLAGFPMHYVNSAYLLARKANISADEVILMKTPKNTWNDVALKIGLTKENCQEVKDRISLEFGRHE